MKISDKTKVLIAISLFKGLKDSIENSLIKCENCDYIIEYTDYCINTLESDMI